MVLSIGIIGASGKMGKALLHAAFHDPEIRVVGGCATPHSSHLGKDLGTLAGREPSGITLKSNLDQLADAAELLIDFSLPGATAAVVQTAAGHRKPLLIGTTGQSSETRLVIETAAKQIPILYSPNFTLGIALCLEATAFFGRHLKGSCFVDVVETHHTHKKDAPSGTALALAKSVDYGHVCPGTLVETPRSQETIAIHSVRTGEVVGEHKIIFECQGERLEIRHEVRSREAFAQGALRAAKFLARCSPGLYSMKDLLHAK